MISDKRNIFYKKISTLCDKFPENYYFLSSRPFTDFIEFQRFTVFSVLPFEKEQAIALTSRLPFDSETKQRFALALENGLFDEHESFASNPLLLTLMLLMYDNYAEIPDKLHLFYEKAFETLYNKTYATESADRRIFKSKLSFDPFRSVFAYFCSISYFKHKIEFSRDEMMEYLTKASKTLDKFVSEDYLDDLLNSVCVMYKDGLSYVFTHRSFQEYFTAFFISKLSDDLIKKIVLEYLYKETSRALEDNVIFMLRDMISDRFEEFVLLPLIVRIDKNLAPGEDKFSFYLEKLFRSFSVYNGLPYCQSESLRIEERNHPVQFLYALMTDDNNSNSVNEEKIIRDFIVEKGSFQIYDNCMRYVDCYKFSLARHNSDYASFISLIKSTSIGRRIIKLTHLKEDIEKRHKENMIDLSSLVDG